MPPILYSVRFDGLAQDSKDSFQKKYIAVTVKPIFVIFVVKVHLYDKRLFLGICF